MIDGEAPMNVCTGGGPWVEPAPGAPYCSSCSNAAAHRKVKIGGWFE